MENEEFQDDTIEDGVDVLDEGSQDDQFEEEKDWKSEAAKWKAIASRNQKKVTPQLNKPNISEPDISRLDRIELKAEGYNDSEIGFIMKSGGIEAKNDPFVKKAILGMREETASLEATPDVTAKSAVYKRYTDAELASMPLSELEKIVPRS